jgi:hypothetical protein
MSSRVLQIFTIFLGVLIKRSERKFGMSEESRLLAGRIIFGVGCAFGAVVFPSALWNIFVFPLESDHIRMVAAVIATASLFSACLLAFWHRRLASYWLLLAACFELYAIVHLGPNELLNFIKGVGFIDLLIAMFGLFSDYSGWEPLKGRQTVQRG